jgi:hypothetical protein
MDCLLWNIWNENNFHNYDIIGIRNKHFTPGVTRMLMNCPQQSDKYCTGILQNLWPQMRKGEWKVFYLTTFPVSLSLRTTMVVNESIVSVEYLWNTTR